MATINYWGLAKKGSVTVNFAGTIDTLITLIASSEGLIGEYYYISKLGDPSINSITYGDSTTTLTQMGLQDGDTVLCTPTQFGSKRERQLQKLAIASQTRYYDGYARYQSDITQLPTQYAADGSLTDNANSGGLIKGRPWLGLAVFSTVGTFTWTAPEGVTSVEYLVVGGGGGGGNAYDNAGGGGGGGGMLKTATGYAVTPGQTYTIVVGDGGAGGTATYPGNADGVAGQDSQFDTIVSKGGGAGKGSRTTGSGVGVRWTAPNTASTGGAGGGAGVGGYGGGGSTSGSAPSGITGGNPGGGTGNNLIGGGPFTYASGGTGGTAGTNTTGAAGNTNRGTGGRGAGAASGAGRDGGKGGAGQVALRYSYSY